MANEYFMNWTDSDIKPPFVLNLSVKDTTTTDLTLFGKGSANYGEGLQENLLRLLENFCSATAPSSPTPGQLWYDYSTKTIKVWDGATWNSTSTQVAATAPASPTNGMLWLDTTDKNLKFWNSTAWQAVTPLAAFDLHASDDSRHLTADQNTLLDGLAGISAEDLNKLSGCTGNIQTQINSEISARTTSDQTRDTNLSNHIADDTKHLTSLQNAWIDSINATSTEINYLSGVTSNVQTQLNTHATDNTKHLTASQNTLIDAITVSSTEINYLAGATSNIQTQLNTLNTGTAGLSAHMADMSLHLTSAQNTLLDNVTVTAAQINYLSGATSNIQTQINTSTPWMGSIKTISTVAPTGGNNGDIWFQIV